MGYTLKIGEAIIDFDLEFNTVSVNVKDVKLDNAPAFGEPTDYENERWPSYIAWGEFMRNSNTEFIFKNEEDGLLREHPGVFPIKVEHQIEINNAYHVFKAKYPNAKAEFSGENTPTEDGVLCRLEWLKFWIDWTMENCENPVFYNS